MTKEQLAEKQIQIMKELYENLSDDDYKRVKEVLKIEYNLFKA